MKINFAAICGLGLGLAIGWVAGFAIGMTAVNIRGADHFRFAGSVGWEATGALGAYAGAATLGALGAWIGVICWKANKGPRPLE